METKSPETLVNLIAKTKLIPAEELRASFGRWRQEAGANAANGDHLLRWLVKRGALTEYQAERLARGQTDRFFLKQYKLLDKIGAGRMAGVYKAQHPLGQIVAIKVLPPSSVNDPKTFGRFQREGRLAVKLKHANVVRTFHLAQDAGLYFIVMEHLEGETLEEMLQRQVRLPPEEAVPIVHQALLGLQHLHDLHIIHRDIKPGNLMLVPQPGAAANQPRVKLLDVGFGKALVEDDSSEDDNDELTMQGDMVGTPDYMAPEQAANAALVDIRADIYSAGCVLYHALTGQPPFPDSNIARKLKRHASEAPAPVKAYNPAVPDGVQDILDWMLAKDPAKRYATPERAAQALAVYQLGAQAPPPPPEVKQQLQKYENWLDEEGLVNVELVPLQPLDPAE